MLVLQLRKQNQMDNLHFYQQHDIDCLFDKLKGQRKGRLLYQLPTSGGKTVIFSEIAKRFIQTFNKKVIVLTHRTELCKQTTKALKQSGVINKVINSSVKKITKKDSFECFVAMVETLKNRIDEGLIDTSKIGLVIVDEAHHNSFHKLFEKFGNASIIGVTATPLSADINLPMKKFYYELIIGEQIASLIDKGFLARPKFFAYDVELNSLRLGQKGDFSITTSDELYSSPAMLDLLMHSYESHCRGKKTLIFNNGIFTSRKVLESFQAKGYPIRHLDNGTSANERTEILNWFKKTKDAVLTSVSILTTGFDEPTIKAVIVNRATTSLTLYHQMVGRGARKMGNKKTFSLIDLGNNADRLGSWEAPLDWIDIFEHPEVYYERLNQAAKETHLISSELRNKFPNSLEISFDVLSAHQNCISQGLKPKTVMIDSQRQHALMCVENSQTVVEGLSLAGELDAEITYRVKQYAKCLGNVTKNYVKWLEQDYKEQLKKMICKMASQIHPLEQAV